MPRFGHAFQKTVPQKVSGAAVRCGPWKFPRGGLNQLLAALPLLPHSLSPGVAADFVGAAPAIYLALFFPTDVAIKNPVFRQKKTCIQTCSETH